MVGPLTALLLNICKMPIQEIITTRYEQFVNLFTPTYAFSIKCLLKSAACPQIIAAKTIQVKEGCIIELFCHFMEYLPPEAKMIC